MKCGINRTGEKWVMLPIMIENIVQLYRK